MKISIPKEWFEKHAKDEEGLEIGAGSPQFMPNRPMQLNGKKERDPLLPMRHRVLVEVAENQWEILGNAVPDPISLLTLEVEKNHAVGVKDKNMMIVDEDNTAVAKFDHYRPEPQNPDEPITEHNARQRDRWIASILKWLLPADLWNAPDTDEGREAVRQCLLEQNVEMSVSPGGGQVVFYRDGNPLADWSV